MNIIEAIRDQNIFGRVFCDPRTWRAWFSVLKALFALEMSDEDLAAYNRHTGRGRPHTKPFREAWLPIGRRGGKSFIAGVVAVFLACFKDYRSVLSPGERAVVMCVSQDRRQARVLFRYIAALIDNVPMLAQMVTERTKEAIHLNNRVSIEVHTASFRAVRGYTIVAAICDEIAFWRDETSANPDEEILAGIRPGMATIPDSLLLSISSPYARRGALWNAYKKHYGQDGPVLVWQADTRAMNPTIPQSVIDEAYDADPEAAAAEYGGQFRRDIDSYVAREAVESCTIEGRLELPFSGQNRYFGFVDLSGGSRDSMTLGIAHKDQGNGSEDLRTVLDVVRERKPPFSPDEVTREFAEILKSYNLTSVTGDRYAGQWPQERFAKYGIRYEPADKTKSEIYQEFLPALNSSRVELLDNPRLIAQLVGLERRTSRSGKDSIDHGPGGHDDLVNSVAGALILAAKSMVSMHAPSGPWRSSPWLTLGEFGGWEER